MSVFLPDDTSLLTQRGSSGRPSQPAVADCMRRACAAAGELMQTMMAMRAVPSAEMAAGSRAVRRLSAVRATGVRAPLSRTAFAASPARQAVVARDNMSSLESYAGPPPLEVVPWTKEASNTVTLTGTVGAVDVRRLASGKTKASLRLAVRNKQAGDAEADTDWCAAPPARLARPRQLSACTCGRLRRHCGGDCRRNCPAPGSCS